MSNLTPELQRYYEERLSMMGSEGWRDLLVDVQQMLAATNTLDGVTPENMRYRQGEVSMMRWMLALKEISEKAYEELKKDENA